MAWLLDAPVPEIGALSVLGDFLLCARGFRMGVKFYRGVRYDFC